MKSLRILNWKVAAVAFGSLVMVSAGLFFVHRVQVGRRGESNYDDALKYEAIGDLDRAAKYYRSYLRYDPDNLDATARYADLLERLAKQPVDHRLALMVMERLLHRDPKREPVRRKALAIARELKLHPEVARHLEVLLAAHPADAELEDQLGQTLEALKRFEEAARHYESAVALDPSRVESYTRLARLARAEPGVHREAEQVFDEAIEKNPTSAKAYLARGLDRRQSNPAAAAADLAKARDLDGDDGDVILALADVRASQGDLSSVRHLLDEGLRKHPQDRRFYLAEHLMELRAGRADQALKWLERGNDSAGDDLEVLWNQANLLIDLGRAKPARETVERMRALNASPRLLAYLDSCMLMLDRKWAEAAAMLEKLLETTDPATMPPLISRQGLLNLASCHGRLGQFAKSEEEYRRALKSEPRSLAARGGLAQSLVEQRRPDDAIAIYRAMGEEDPSALARALPLMIEQVMKSSPAGRDWGEVEETLKTLEKARPGSFEGRMISAQVLWRRDRADEAEESLKKTREAFPDRVEPWLAQAEIQAKTGGVERIPALLDEAEKRLGDQVAIRLARAGYWARAGGNDAAAAKGLRGLERGIEAFPEEDRVGLLRALGTAYENRGDLADALRLRKAVAALRADSPDDQSVLFRVALQAGAVDEGAAALASIRRIEGEDGRLTLICEALRILSSVKSGTDPRLAEARALLTRAGARGKPRPELFRALGQIEELSGDREQAVIDYLKAIKGGDYDAAMIRQTVLLLYGGRRFDEAHRLLETLRLSDALPSSLVRLRERVEERSAPTKDLIDSAKTLLKSGSTDPDDYLWLADLLNASRRTAEQEPLLQKALELAPDRAEPRFAWARYLIRTGRRAEAEAAVEAAREPLLKNGQSLTLASCYELVGNEGKAAALFTSVLAAQPRNPVILRAFADFHQRHGRVAEAKALLESLVTLKESAPREAAWASRLLVLQQCARSDDAGIMELLAGLDKTTLSPSAREEDRMMNLRVRGVALARQPAQPRWHEAVDCLEKVVAHGYSTTEDEFLLAVLQDEHGNWKRAEELLDRLVRSERDPTPMLFYRAKALLRHARPAAAAEDLAELKTLGLNGLAAAELEAGILNAREKPEAAVAALTSAVHGQPAAIRARGAAILEDLKSTPALKAAESLLVELAEEGKQPEHSLALALFWGRRGRRSEAMGLCERVRDAADPIQMATVANALASLPGNSTADLARISGWVDALLEHKPDLAPLHALRGTLDEQQGHFDRAEASYRRSLTLDPRGVVALNNLAWLTALKPGQGAEALALIERAIAILGPEPALLDTRAMARLALGKFDQSVADLEQSVATEPKVGRLFHLARAQFLNGNSPASAAAYKQAKSRGLTADMLHPLERASLAEFAEKFPDI